MFFKPPSLNENIGITLEIRNAKKMFVIYLFFYLNYFIYQFFYFPLDQ